MLIALAEVEAAQKRERELVVCKEALPIAIALFLGTQKHVFAVVAWLRTAFFLLVSHPSSAPFLCSRPSLLQPPKVVTNAYKLVILEMAKSAEHCVVKG